jgi:hypothetical protein
MATQLARPQKAEPSRDRSPSFRFALLTGWVGWRERSDFSTPESMVVAAQFISALALLTVAAVSMTAERRVNRWPLAAICVALVAILIAPTLASARDRAWFVMRPSLAVACLRVAAGVALVGCWAALLGKSAPLGAWLIGVVIGTEIALTAWVLGVSLEPSRWWWRFQRSSVHVGVLVAMVSVLVVAPTRRGAIVVVYLTFQLVVAVAVFTVAAVARAWRRIDQRQAADVDLVRAEAHREFAHWVHDDVCAGLRLVRLRIESGAVTADAIPAELDALDHGLRLRQLDEVLAAGEIQLAEILQPYVRLAQNRGVRIGDVPRFEQASITVPEVDGRSVQRAISVLVSNALNAGATCLSFRLEAIDNDAVVVEVDDDAGGFELAQVPAGRGLDGLRTAWGTEALTVSRTANGSRVSVLVPLAGRA